MKRQREHDYKQPRYKKRRTSTTKLGYNASRANPRPNRLEIKAFDVGASASVFSAAGVRTVLNAVPLGNDYYQRTGRKLTMKSLHLKGTINMTATVVQDYLRLLILYDSQTNKNLPATADILLDANAAPGTTSYSELNLNFRERFRVLRDKRYFSPPGTYTGGVITNNVAFDQTENLEVNEFIKLRGLETQFDATNGGTVADITSGSLVLLTIGTNTGTWTLNYQTRLRYYD